ncbi:GTPase subunit of restriction endonuclease [Rhizobium leguminosarum bv. trifolii WSM2297]|uniref:GTPase subunit of restriction endonuclease n=1 Tax=Rhizobium leguminosarum bv. trifolii WSM2297 TaxID=754762 RepID=J0D0I9_RHILT|nr:AAA family ATPase [Rhizobium leguminosarum]EJC85301.1 GTPase subunit of restriction endonuclease [Rhizobium leguminosarum bv. trifolii WSM2297]EJC85815.1 GTPase subunit of restriction endonuclease [Rhizobium leguminosarum bv. trifolii WSM2297]
MIDNDGWLVIRKEQALAYGKELSSTQFLVRVGSTTMREGTPKEKRNRPERDRLVASGILVPDDNPALFRFAKDHVFSSKSAAAGVVIDGNSNGSHWKNDGLDGAVTAGSESQQALLDLLTRKEIDAAMLDCDRLGLNGFLSRAGFVRPQVWVKGSVGEQTYPAKATVAGSLAHLPNGRALSAKEFFHGFGETQAFSTLERLGYEVVRKEEALEPEPMGRDAIEAAMDAYDSYRSSGANADVFEAFGEPRDYWVRSTRLRPNRVYPSKPVHFCANGTKGSSGGWGGPTYSAAALHNSGFIIVDQDDKPVVPPDKDYLIKGADRARLVALNYFIEPARERGDAKVAVRVGDVSEKLFPTHHYRNVWSALRSEAFQELARVPKPTQTGVDESSATILTYQLTPSKGQSSMSPDYSAQTPATNLILYGPPGTGKTYQTAWEAVRLCLGDTEAKPFLGNDKRDALMAEYRRLVDSGRIEFVTFHQSMSYEEFVEGLRPTTGRSPDPEAPLEEEVSSGFRLEPQAGIFKRISERAADDRGDAGAGGLDRTRRIYRIGLTGEDWRADLQRAIDEKEIAWGFGGDTDWSAPEYEDWEAIKQRRKVDDASVKGNHATVYGTWLVRSGAADGAYVILTVGRNRVVAFGRFAGDYKFTPSSEGAAARHARPVEWIWTHPAGIDRSTFYETPFTSFHPIYPLERDLIDWPALESQVLGSEAPANPRPHVLIIDEVNRANISKVFGELITLLEPDKRLGTANEIRLTLPYSKKRFGVPSNLHIIATMNTADRSIALLDTALRRRFTFRELMPDPDVLRADVEGIDLRKLLRTINERIEYLFDREHQIGHAYFTGCDTRAKIASVMRYKVIPLLAEYFYEDWSKVAAVLGDAAQDSPRFLVREVITAPAGLDTDTFSGARYRWRVRSEVQGDKNGGFDFTKFEV